MTKNDYFKDAAYYQNYLKFTYHLLSKTGKEYDK